MNKRPNEERITEMLENIQPKPSDQFYKRMSNAPWTQSTQQKEPRMNTTRLPSSQVRLLAAAAAIALVIAAFIAVPPLRTLAQEFFSQFFAPAASNTLTHNLEVIQPTPIANAQFWQPDTIASVQAQASFDVKTPGFVPEGYTLEGATYSADYHLVSQYFVMGATDQLRRNLVIHQYPAGADEPTTIGADAKITPVQINGVTGEYVQGGWDVTSSTETGSQVQIQTTWNPDIQMHFLRWQVDGMNYEILFQAAYIPNPAYFSGGAPDQPGYLTLDDLVKVAESIS